MHSSYDIVIIGAGPAGCAAAMRARKERLSTLLVDTGFPHVGERTLTWCGPAAISACEACGVDAEKAGASPFRGLRLYSWELEHCVQVDDAALHGWIVNASRLLGALRDAITRKGADFATDARPNGLRLGERDAVVRLDSGLEIDAQLVIVTEGPSTSGPDMVRAAAALQTPVTGHRAEVVFSNARPETGLDVVVGARRGAEMASIARHDDIACVEFFAEEQTPAFEESLMQFVRRAEAKKLLVSPALDPADAGPSVAGAALDMESHVGKRSLLAGEAGGFVASFSHDRLFPGLRSGWLAAEAAVRAIEAPVLQDELVTFSSTWRAELADYMRMPNTDLSLLMPLVFNNPQMSARVARAFLLGEGF